MYQTILTILLFCLSNSSIAQTVPSKIVQKMMENECDSFLMHMPTGLQHLQSNAVKAAIKGDFKALEYIRNGRNTTPELPEGINKTYLTPTLCLFQPSVPSSTLRPVLLYLHGGGWSFGSINSCSRFCAAVAQTAQCAVIALDYRLAPEYPFPAALEDCISAYKFIKRHGTEWGCDTARISIGGDSAGGNLSIATALSTPGVYSLIPIYPVTKVFIAPSDSWNQYAVGYGCDAELLESFNQAYARKESQNSLVSVALATNSDLRNLPPTLFISAGRDILYDQGAEMVGRLQENHVKVSHIVFPTATHLFITVPGQPTAFAHAVYEVSNYIKNK